MRFNVQNLVTCNSNVLHTSMCSTESAESAAFDRYKLSLSHLDPLIHT